MKSRAETTGVRAVKELTSPDAARRADASMTEHREPLCATTSPVTRIDPHASRARLVSLDAFRGLTILGMLLVNNAALDNATPKFFTHAAWNQGVHFADMVFPWFVLIVGVALPFSAVSHRKRGLPAWKYDLRILRRTVILVLLGCFIDSSLAMRPLFDMGILQLIGFAYFVSALLCELPLTRRLLIAALFLVGHWAAIRFLPVPGIGVGVITESKNLINHLNAVYLQPYHLDGLLSVVPTAALALIGTALGEVLRSETLKQTHKTACLLAAGLCMIALGWVWNLDLPFSKSLWTASYILYTAGWGALLFGLMYLFIEANGWRAWAFPFVVFGANAIFAYTMPILVKIYILNQWKWKTPDGSLLPLQSAYLGFCIHHAGSRVYGGWLYTLSYILFWWVILWQMHRKQFFVRV